MAQHHQCTLLPYFPQVTFPLDEDALPRDEHETLQARARSDLVVLFLQRLPGGNTMLHAFGPGAASVYKYQLDMALEMGTDADHGSASLVRC